jgi:S-(hydroxymethyl)glutathione dehydrogenase / alcohol dehydrogenase
VAVAAVCKAIDEQLVVEDLELADPRQGEIRVRLNSAAVCHSDLHVRGGVLAGNFPMVLGHEGAGTVTATGPDVTRHSVGDRVIVTPMPQCGQCRSCRRDQGYLCEQVGNVLAKGTMADGTTRWMSSDGQAVHQLSGVGSFAEETVVSELSAFPIGDMPFESAAMVGCRVLTGVGAALNTASIQPGDSVAVIGCGAVGLSVIQGARIAGASVIIAIDPLPARREFAVKVGATHTFPDLVESRSQVRAATGRRGADVVFDVVGATSTLDSALSAVRRGGEIVVVGVSSNQAELRIPALNKLLVGALTVKGSWLGSANLSRDVPRFLEFYRTGALLLDELGTKVYPLQDINHAFDAVSTGSVVCAVVSCQ